jgi:hypothetical protein
MGTNITKKGYRYTKMDIGDGKIGIYTYGNIRGYRDTRGL